MFGQLWNITQLYDRRSINDIERVKKVQRRFTEWLHGLKDLTNSQRLKVTNLESLELRRLHADLIMCYKMYLDLSI